MDKIPAEILRGLIKDWKRRYGPTFPLYGKETVRHDISGSVRPLLPSTEISHSKILAEKSGLSLRIVSRIESGETEWVSFEVADSLVTAMECPEEWFNSLADYY